MQELSNYADCEYEKVFSCRESKIRFLKTAFSVSSSYREKKRLHLTFNSISPRWLSITVCLRPKGLQERVLLGQG